MAPARLAAALRELRELLGPLGFVDRAEQVAPYLTDFRHLYRGRTACVVRPQSREQVVGLSEICARHRVAMVPHGGNTGYCGGATPDESGTQVVVSFARLDAVRAVDAQGYSMTLEAGVTLARAQQIAESVERLFPLTLGSQGSCQIGGNVSTNAGGTQVLRYGGMRDLVLGLEVVLPGGRVLDQLRTLRKDNTGYDLKQLFIGAEGTLGFITAASLKLFPRSAHATALVAVDDLEACVALLSRLRAELGDVLLAFEIMPRTAIELAVRHVAGVSDPLREAHAWYVLIEASCAAQANVTALFSALQSCLEAGAVRDAIVAQSEARRQSLWHLRENIPAAQTRAGASLKHDISLPIASIPEFVAAAGAAVTRVTPPGTRMVAYGHLGDGNLHFNFGQPENVTAADFAARADEVKRIVHDTVRAFGGSISAEHGIGRLKVAELERYEDPTALALMRSIKQTLDPLQLMNPGKVLSIDPDH